MGFKEFQLKDVCSYSKERIGIDNIKLSNYISTENLLPDKAGKVAASSLPKVKSVAKYRAGDTLISNIRPYFRKIWFSEEGGGASGDVLIFRPNEELVYNKYLYYFLSQNEVFDYMVQTSKGTKMPRGDKAALMTYPIVLPSMEKQKEIAMKLSDLDKKIKFNTMTIKNLEQLAQTLFKRWFVDFEFPNENGEPYKSNGGEMVESELGMVPNGWKSGRLTDIATLIMGQSPKSDSYNEDGMGLPLINGASDFRKDHINPLKYTTDPKRLSEKGDFIFGVRATVGNVTYVDQEYALGRGVGVARVKKEEYREILYFQLINGIDYLKSTATGSVYINLTKNDIEGMQFVIPGLKYVNKFHENIASFFEQKNLLISQNKALENLRDTLLPKLLSGEIELLGETEVMDDVSIPRG